MSAERWCHREELNLCRRSSQNRVPFRGTVACAYSLGDRNRTCGLVVPDHALSLLSYTQISRKTQESNPIPNEGNTAFEAGAAPTATLPSKQKRGRSGGS